MKVETIVCDLCERPIVYDLSLDENIKNIKASRRNVQFCVRDALTGDQMHRLEDVGPQFADLHEACYQRLMKFVASYISNEASDMNAENQ